MGFDLERFVSPVNPGLVCGICRGVLQSPLLAPQCEHAYCGACIQAWLGREDSCPEDRGPLDVSELRPVFRYMKNDLDGLQIRCQYSDCDAICSLEILERHEASCEFAEGRSPSSSREDCDIQQERQIEAEQDSSMADHNQDLGGPPNTGSSRSGSSSTGTDSSSTDSSSSTSSSTGSSTSTGSSSNASSSTDSSSNTTSSTGSSTSTDSSSNTSSSTGSSTSTGSSSNAQLQTLIQLTRSELLLKLEQQRTLYDLRLDAQRRYMVQKAASMEDLLERVVVRLAQIQRELDGLRAADKRRARETENAIVERRELEEVVRKLQNGGLTLTQ